MIDVDFFDFTKYERNDIGLARLFHDCFVDELLYCADTDTWYSWNGKHWQEDNILYRNECAKTLYSCVTKAIFSIPELYGNSEILKFYQSISRKNVRDKIIADAQSIEPVVSSQFDQRKYLFNCKNGTYDFKTATFREHRREDYLTRMSNVTYDKDATCPMFEKYLYEVMDNSCGKDTSEEQWRSVSAKMQYLMKIAAYCLSGDTSRECFFVLYGEKTRNGKSTFVSTLTYLMGNYAETLKPASITRKNISTGGSSATPDLAKLTSARLATVSELEEGMMLDISLIKTMTGGNALAVRKLYKDETSFVPQFHILIDTNYLPRMTDDSIFSSDRIHLLRFDRHFEEHERDMTLKEKLQTEVDGIFNMLCYFYAKLASEGWCMPKQSRDTIHQYALASNVVRQFCAEKLFVKKNAYEKATDVFNAFNEWLEENSSKSRLTKRNFYQRLVDIGYTFTPKGVHRSDSTGLAENTIFIKDVTLVEPIPDAQVISSVRTTDKPVQTSLTEIDVADLPFDTGNLGF